MGIYYNVCNYTRGHTVETDTKGYPPGYVDIIAKIFGWDLENDLIVSVGDYEVYTFVKDRWEWFDQKNKKLKVEEYKLDPALEKYRINGGNLRLSDPIYRKTLSKTPLTNILLCLTENSPIKAHLMFENRKHYWRYEIDDPMTEEEIKLLMEPPESSGESDEPKADVAAGAGTQMFTEKEEE